MNTTTAISKLEADEAHHIREAERARAAKEKLIELFGSAPPPNPRKANGKAPHGHLASCIMSVLDRKTALTNQQIVSALLSSGYQYPLSGKYMTKALVSLLDAKRIKRVGKRGYILP